MAKQLSFDLPAKPALGRGDFFVSPANGLAVTMIDRWTEWPAGKLVLSGPEGSGKTHLVQVWAAQSGAQVVPAAVLAEADIPALASGPVAVEDVPDLRADTDGQKALFHLHNLLKADAHPLLMTGRDSPRSWSIPLPDLQSRIEGAQHVSLDAPDDALLAAVLAKLFADRQIVPKPDVIPYLVQRMDRSFGAAADIVERLDRAALAEKRSLSRPFCIRILGEDGCGD